MRRFIFVAVSAIAVVSSVRPRAIAEAQAARESKPSLRSLRPGDTVRVWAVSPQLNGSVASFSRLGDTYLTLSELSGAYPFSPSPSEVPIVALRRIDVRRGVHRSTARALIGIVLGTTGGVIVGAPLGLMTACGRSCSGKGEHTALGGWFLGATVGGLTGAITGGVIGARPRPRWESVTAASR